MLAKLAHARNNLGPAEKRLTDYILANPQKVTQMSIASLGAEAQVSEPTIIRLARKLGCGGFPDFKLRIVQSLAAGLPYVHQDIVFEDNVSTVVSKIFNSTITTLTNVRDDLNIQATERAIELLARAHRIDFMGTGPSSIAALDAQQKFLRLDVPVVFFADTHLQTMAASMLRSTDVAVCFSYSGQTKDIVRCARRARDAGATVIGVTRTGSALAEVSTVVVGVDTPEDTFLYLPMTTRLAHLAVVDILSMGVAIRRGPGAADRFRTMKEALIEERIAD